MAEMTGRDEKYRLIDQPFAEQFVIWAMRSWVAGLKEGTAKSFALQRGFEIAGIPHGVQALDMLLGTVATGTTRPLDVRCIRCCWISDDERTMVAAIRACQDGTISAATSVFSCFLVPEAARMAAVRAAKFASELTRAKLLLRQTVPDFALSHWVMEPQFGAETFH